MGGTFGALSNAGTQFVANGFEIEQIKGGDILSAFVGGAVSGAIIGSGLGIAGAGITALKAAAINAGGGVAGGLVERWSSGNMSSSIYSEALAVTLDASTSMIGGYRGGALANALAPLPRVNGEIAALKYALFSMTQREAVINRANWGYAGNAFISGVAAEAVAGAGTVPVDYLYYRRLALDEVSRRPPLRECVSVNIEGIGSSSNTCQ